MKNETFQCACWLPSSIEVGALAYQPTTMGHTDTAVNERVRQQCTRVFSSCSASQALITHTHNAHMKTQYRSAHKSLCARQRRAASPVGHPSLSIHKQKGSKMKANEPNKRMTEHWNYRSSLSQPPMTCDSWLHAHKTQNNSHKTVHSAHDNCTIMSTHHTKRHALSQTSQTF